MALIIRCTHFTGLILLLLFLETPTWAKTFEVKIPCAGPVTLSGGGNLLRAKKDGDVWVFQIVPADGENVAFSAQDWSFNGLDPVPRTGEPAIVVQQGGRFNGGDGTNYLSWSSPMTPTADRGFTVTVTAKRRCGTGGIGGNGLGRDDTFTVGWGGSYFECGENSPISPDNVTVGIEAAAPTVILDDARGELGRTNAQSLNIEISACLGEDQKWHAVLLGLSGGYFIKIDIERLVNNQPLRQIIRVPGNVTRENFCPQVEDLRLRITQVNSNVWIDEAAILAHEQVHASTMKKTLLDAAGVMEQEVEELTVDNTPVKTQEQAIAALRALPEFAGTDDGNGGRQGGIQQRFLSNWLDQIGIQAGLDDETRPGMQKGAAYLAEIPILNARIAEICRLRRPDWEPCAACP